MADQRLLPSSIRDASTDAMAVLIDRTGTVDITPLLVYLIDNVAASALPHLAEQFSVTGYDGWALANGETDRRELIKQAIELHRHKGTGWAVKQAIAALGFAGEISEWFEYGGDPYRFRVSVIIPDGLPAPDNYLNSLPGIVDEYKSVRSHCDKITVSFAQPAGGVYIASASVVGMIITTQPHP